MAQQPAGDGKLYRFFVDDKPFDSPEQIITGAQLREIAQVDSKYNVFLDIRQKRDHNPDLLIHNSSSVNLADPGSGAFYTLHRPTMDITMRQPFLLHLSPLIGEEFQARSGPMVRLIPL